MLNSSGWAIWDAYIRYYLHLEPDLMDEDTYFKRQAELKLILKQEGKIKD